MTVFIIVIHTMACVFLTIAILMQSGKGGGLAESFSSAESMFGAQTSSFMVKTTTILAAIFLVTSLSLAFLSTKRDRSLLPGSLMTKTRKVVPVNAFPTQAAPGIPVQGPVKIEAPAAQPVAVETPAVEAPAVPAAAATETAPAPSAK